MSASDCAIIVLASGQSKRFGAENKLLARLAGKAVIDHVLDTITPIEFGISIAVIGQMDAIESALQGRLKTAGFDIVINPKPENGQGSSLALGAQAVIAAGFNRACIALADMPCVPQQHYMDLLYLAQSSEQVMSEAHIKGRDVTLPPAIFSGGALTRLTKASGDMGAKRFLREDVARQKVARWYVKDIDTLADLQALEQHMKDLNT